MTSRGVPTFSPVSEHIHTQCKHDSEEDFRRDGTRQQGQRHEMRRSSSES